MEQKEIEARAKEIIESLGDIEITPMTRDETAILVQRLVNLANDLIIFSQSYTNMVNQFNRFQSEFVNSQEFIVSKGLRKEYQIFKDKKLKVFNRNRRFK